MLGTAVPALLLALRIRSVFAAAVGWDAVYNVDRRINRTSLRYTNRKDHNIALLHKVDSHADEPGKGLASHGWTRDGHGPVPDKGGGRAQRDESSSSKWFWGEESNEGNANWGGPGYFGGSKEKAGDAMKPDAEKHEPAAVSLGAATNAQEPCAPTLTMQPSTRGQDEGTCGWLDLPDRFFMRVKVAEHTALKGDWENDSGAQYVEFVQDLFAWQYETVYFYTGSKLFMKTEVIANEEVQLPSVKLQNARENEKHYFTIALKDCNDILMYVLREKRTPPYTYEIYNRDDQLVAYSEFGSLHVDKIFWYDHLKKPIAISQSPRLVENAYRMIDDRADPYFGNVPTWEVKFIHGYDPSEIVSIMQNRWVIAAAIQERAIRSVARGPDGKPDQPEAFPWFVGLTIFALAVCVGAVAYCFYWIFRLVYPKSYKEVENKFLKHDKQIYGELVRGRYGSVRS